VILINLISAEVCQRPITAYQKRFVDAYDAANAALNALGNRSPIVIAVWGVEPARDANEVRANMRLLAAAPDMAEAIKSMYEELAIGEPLLPEGYLNFLRELLTKAGAL
jgi:hypothetical protein